MIYIVTIRTGRDEGNEKLHFEFTQDEINKLKKDSIKTNYDGSLVMKNGDVIQYEKEGGKQ